MKLPIPEAVFKQHTAVLGKTRSGKSSAMRLLVEHLLERQDPVAIVDPKGDWWGIKLSSDGKRPGYPVVIFGGEHADVPINEHSGAHVAELFATGNRPCLIDLGGWMPGARTRFWIDYASSLFRHARGMRWLVVDEIHNFAPKGKVMDPDSGKALHWANRLASEGLGKGLHMLFASQRPQKVHNDTLTSAETLIAMRVLHPSDRGAVSDWIKGCGDLELGAKVLNSLAQMDRGEGWVWSPESGFGPERVQFPMFKTYDSFRPQSVEETGALKGWAEVDLEEVKAKLAEVVQEAEANDPARLKQELRKARNELEQLRAGHADAAPDTAALAEAMNRGYEQGIQVGRETILDRVSAIYEQLKAGATAIDAAEELLSNLHQGEAAPKMEPKVYAKRHTPPPPPLPIRILEPRGNGGASDGGAQQKILNALAELEQLGANEPRRIMVAFLSGYTNLTSKGFVNGLSALRTDGLVDYPDQGRVVLTAEGRKRAKSPPKPRSPQELQTRLIGLLGGASGRILEPLIGAYPKSIARQTLAERAGYGNLTSKGFVNAMSRLRSLGFIDYQQRGQVVAQPVLFLEN